MQKVMKGGNAKMKTLAIVAIVAGLLLIAGVFLAGGITAHGDDDSSYECNSGSCPNYESGCTAQNNCGYSSCPAANGRGSCGGCGR